MKKNFLLAIMVLISVTAYAQNEKFAAGLNIGYGAEVGKLSVGIKANYDINEMFAIAPSFNYYFQDKESYEGMETKLNAWDLNCDLHFNVVRKERFKFYPLAGISYLHAKATANYEGIEVSASDGNVGVNLGVGAEFAIASRLVIAPEAKYQIISDYNQFVISVALMYKF